VTKAASITAARAKESSAIESPQLVSAARRKPKTRAAYAERRGCRAAEVELAAVALGLGEVAGRQEDVEATFFASSGIALLGALVTFVLVRKNDRLKTPGPGVLSRRSRWIATGVGRSPAVSRRPALG
jgi:hypothetical protein